MVLQDASAKNYAKRHRTPEEHSDQQRGVVLGPPGAPQGTKTNPQAQIEDRLKSLELRLNELSRMMDMVKAQV